MVAEVQQQRDRNARALRRKKQKLDAILESARELPKIADEIATLTVRVAQLDAMLAAWKQPSAPAAGTPAAPSQTPRNKTKSLPAPDTTKGVAGLIVKALEEAGPTGLSGGEINRVVIAAGHTIDAAEKSKNRLKKHFLVIHRKIAQRWYALDAGVPPEPEDNP
jgi:hypothetical protein